MKWIKASERLPEISTRCYVRTQKEDGVISGKLATYYENGWLIEDDWKNTIVIEWLDESEEHNQDELWDELIDILSLSLSEELIYIGDIEEAKSKYTITPKY